MTAALGHSLGRADRAVRLYRMLRIRKTLPVRHHQDRVRRVVASGEVTWGGKSNRVNELSHDGGTQTNATVSDAMLKTGTMTSSCLALQSSS